MSRDIRLYLDDILEAINKIELYLEVVDSYDQFRTEDMTKDAVVYNLFVIGEAIKHVPDDLRNKDPQIEWRKIAGMRDHIAHGYFGIDAAIVWDTVTNKLDAVKITIASILNDLDSQES